MATYLKGQGVRGFSRDFHVQGPPHKHRLPQISPRSSFFFFFLLLLPSQPPKPTEYTAIPQHQLPPKMRITLFMLATLFHLALCQGPGPPAPPVGGDEPEPGSKCCSTVPRCDNNPDVSEDPT